MQKISEPCVCEGGGSEWVRELEGEKEGVGEW